MSDRQVLRLISQLGSAESSDVLAAMRSLRELGPKAVPDLRRTLGHTDPQLQGMAAQVLGDIGADAQEAAEDLQDLLQHEVIAVRILAHGALAQIGDTAEDHVDYLVRCFDHGGDLAERAQRALLRLGKRAVPHLAKALAGCGYRRFYAASTLGTIGRDAHQSLPALREALETERLETDDGCSEQIAYAIQRAIRNVQ